MLRLSRLTNKFLSTMENQATADTIRLRKRNAGKLTLIGAGIGIVVVILVALWVAYHR
ncbi:MAG TPA: hypothetical protein VK829_04115 [Terriglobales bacterium]|jgi:hypothetical protein|nr:hypothetical protein [Terriglobales bacterium]